jgi:hypothetical protein
MWTIISEVIDKSEEIFAVWEIYGREIKGVEIAGSLVEFVNKDRVNIC